MHNLDLYSYEKVVVLINAWAMNRTPQVKNESVQSFSSSFPRADDNPVVNSWASGNIIVVLIASPWILPFSWC